MKVSFQLTMPNVGSWNGKWTGAAKKYWVIRTYRSKEDKEKISNLLAARDYQSFYYNFGDGWGANIRIEIVGPGEARQREKHSAGFCGYEWMINSILKHGKILIDEPKTTA